ncbi:MAG: PIN domain-containing protein [Bacillota bacterium]|nr:PIN domain-containing protein [Bacillota bacterium]
MKILIDTNVLLDVLAKREPFYAASAQVLRLSESGELSAFITANTVTDIVYIIGKHISDKSALHETVKRVLGIVDVANVLKSDVLKAFELGFADYEDALLARCAKRIKADYIVTRNTKDFEDSPVAAITPEDFLDTIHFKVKR